MPAHLVIIMIVPVGAHKLLILPLMEDTWLRLEAIS